MTTKRCSKCGQDKLLDDFHRNAKRKDGRHPYCKPCMRETNRLSEARRRAEKPDEVKASYRKWLEQNAEAERERSRAWKEQNREATRQYARQYQRENLAAAVARNAKRRAGLEQRACLLKPEDEAKIKALYGFAAYLTEKFGQPYHVDHIVPLHGETCSGLHHPDNLRVIPAQLNLSKSNKIDYELVPHAFRPEEN